MRAREGRERGNEKEEKREEERGRLTDENCNGQEILLQALYFREAPSNLL